MDQKQEMPVLTSTAPPKPREAAEAAISKGIPIDLFPDDETQVCHKDKKQNKKPIQQQQSHNAATKNLRKKNVSIDLRYSLSPSLHANNTHVTESHRLGKKKRSLTRSPHNRFRCCKTKLQDTC
jgi:hypothetical protein